MQKKQPMTETTERERSGVAVPLEFQVVETVRDVIVAEPNGDHTLGQTVDFIVDSHFREGRELGRITLDLSEFSRAFCVKRDQR